MSLTTELYAIIDAEAFSEPVATAEAALSAGCGMLQLRGKHLCDRELVELAIELRARCQRARTPFVLNDRADIARIVRADGVHLGQDDLTVREVRPIVGDMQIGVSTHDLAQARRADREGADLVAFGPVFQTHTKANPDPVVGLQALAEVCREVSRPVVAIGGITPENAEETLRTGARFIAVISALPRFIGGGSSPQGVSSKY